MNHPYADIIDLDRPVSRAHRPMSAYDRAAQFSPFAALVGHDAAIRETARQTDREHTLELDGEELLDEKLRSLQEQLDRQPAVRVCWFEPDERKAGGRYLQKQGRVLRLDAQEQRLIFSDGEAVEFSRILELEIGPGQ